MLTPSPSPFVRIYSCVVRRGFVLGCQVTPTPCAPAEAERRARKQQKKQEKQEARLRSFFGWCEGCSAYASIF